MPLDLPLALRLEANKLIATGPWLLLLELTLPDTSVLRLARNTEDITFDGHTWTAYPFLLGEQSESGDGKVQSVTLQVSNVTRALTPWLEANSGLVGSSISLMTVQVDNLGTPTDYVDLTLTYSIMGAQLKADWVTFTLGAENPMRRRFPPLSAIPLHCNWVPHFKGAECNFLSGAASNQVASATVDTAGTGGTNGTQTVTGTTGTGRKFQASVTVAGGGITAVLSILYGGSYTADPTTNGEPVTGAALTGAKLDLVMAAETCDGSLVACQYKGNGARFGGRPGITGAPRFVR